MISPHLLKVVESHSTSFQKSVAMAQAEANSMWGDRPVFTIEPKDWKKSKWCHMILAHGPILDSDLDDDPKGSELIVIWWSEMEPDTSRVLSAVDWEKHAKNY